MSCQNTVTLWTPKGREVPLQCGRTGFHGELVLCDECERPDIRRHILTNSDEPEDIGFQDRG
jgi:hypothetical protein